MGDVEDSRLLSDVRWLAERLGELPEPVAEPAFVAVSGLPGTGKSYFCRRLVERLPSIILESDALRKELFPQPSYSPEEMHRNHYVVDTSRDITPVLDKVVRVVGY